MTTAGTPLDLIHAPLLAYTNERENGTNPTGGDTDTSDITWRYFLSLMIIILVHRAVGTVFHKLGIPRIIGDIVAGCMLGPTIMGSEANWWLFPAQNRAILNMLSVQGAQQEAGKGFWDELIVSLTPDCFPLSSGQFGLIMTSMAAGFSFDRRVMSGRTAKICVYTLLNMGIPALVSVPLYYILPNNTNWRGADFDGAAYYVLVACAMSSSALPMVFLILDEMRVNNDTSRFAIGLSCLSTIGLFTLLSVVSVLSDPSLSESLIVIRLIFLALVFVFLFVVQYVWGYFLARAHHDKSAYGFLRYGSDDMAILVISLGLISAICSERLGYTFLLGAFLAGAAMPFDIGLRSNLGEKVRWMTRWLFLPQFFVYAGLKFDLRELKPQSIPYVILFLVLAFVAKALLVPITHHLLKIQWRDAAFCASLANCRGFNALIVAQVGSQYGLIGNSFFITCVLLSIFSTLATGPLAKLFRPQDEPHARTALKTTHGPKSSGSMDQQIKQPLSPRLHGATDGGGTGSSFNEDAKLDDISLDNTSVPDSIRIVLPGLSDSSSSSSHGPTSSRGDSLSGFGHAASTTEQREAFFSSWLSENYDSKTKVLVIVAEDLKARLRDPASTLPTDSSSGEIRFRGDLFVDYLCALYTIENRAVAVQAGQRLLEANVIAPVDTAVFLDKPLLFTIGGH